MMSRPRGRHAAPPERGGDAPDADPAPTLPPGRHRVLPARRRGSLRRAAGWTVLGGLVPGAGLLSSRHQFLARTLVALFLLLLGALVVTAVVGEPFTVLLTAAFDRTTLLVVGVALVVLLLLWSVLVLVTNRHQNRRHLLTGTKRVVSILVAVAMIGGAAVPTVIAERYLSAHLGLLNELFVDDGGRSTLGTGPDPWAGTERIEVLMMGRDDGETRTGIRIDTILVASIDTSTGRTALFSVPRNLEDVEFPAGTVMDEEFPDGFDAYGQDQNLINAVWQWASDDAEDHPSDWAGIENPGLRATKWAVEETLGLGMDYHAMVNLAGFESMIDAIGGIDMNVERRIPIGGGTNQATGESYPVTGYIEEGPQTLDGYESLWYVRSREGSDDFDRICRQQRMIREVTQQADPVRLAASYPRLAQAAGENIVTSVPASDVDAFVLLALRVQEAGIQSFPITTDVTWPGDPDYEYLEQWVQDAIDTSMATWAEENDAADPSASPAGPATDDAAGEDAAGNDAAGDGGSGDASSGDSASEGTGSGGGTSEDTGSGEGTPAEETPGDAGSPEPTEDPSRSPEVQALIEQAQYTEPADPLWTCSPGFEEVEKKLTEAEAAREELDRRGIEY